MNDKDKRIKELDELMISVMQTNRALINRLVRCENSVPTPLNPTAPMVDAMEGAYTQHADMRAVYDAIIGVILKE